MSTNDNWEHQSTNMKCTTCMWWVQKADFPGRCRKHAPTLNGWPATFETDWCGDHKLNETKLPPVFPAPFVVNQQTA